MLMFFKNVLIVGLSRSLSEEYFFEPDYYLGNITETPLIELVASEKQLKRVTARQFAAPFAFIIINT